jgi:ornithine cyclodeaminase/alanine dehydrogenase-like protein (mu-crystallin family)
VAAEVLVLSEQQIRSVLDMESCIDAVQEAFAAYSDGRASLPDVISLEVAEREAEIHVKAGYVAGGEHYAVKFAAGFPHNDELGLRTSDGAVMVFDAETGAPTALLLDHGCITDVRTGAAGGVAARWLAPKRVVRVAVIGTGEQSRRQLEALAVVRPGFREVRVWGRSAQHADRRVSSLGAEPFLPKGCVVERSESLTEACDGAHVIVTCTASTAALVSGTDLGRGAHVTALGSDGVGKQELDPAILRGADVLVADSRDQCVRLGELQHAPELVQEGAVVELGEVVSGKAPGRASDEQDTVCDLTGVGVQDVAAASLVVRRARERSLGRTVTA